MLKNYTKILSSVIVGISMCFGGVLISEDIKVDTIKVNKTRNIKIVTVMTVPKLILQLSGSYNSGAMELTSHNGGFSKFDFEMGKNFGARNGFGVNLTGKLPLNKKGQYWLDVTAGFVRFQSDLFAKNTEEGSVAYNSISFGAGLEYNFTPYHRVKYYFGANPLVSIISGKATLINPDNARVDLKINSAVRIGYSVYMGLEYAFDKSVGLNTGIKFTHANLLMKKSVDPGDNPSSIDLNDNSSSVVPQIPFSGWKQFAYVTAYAGISYFLGVKERRYKLP